MYRITLRGGKEMLVRPILPNDIEEMRASMFQVFGRD